MTSRNSEDKSVKINTQDKKASSEWVYFVQRTNKQVGQCFVVLFLNLCYLNNLTNEKPKARLLTCEKSRSFFVYSRRTELLNSY